MLVAWGIREHILFKTNFKPGAVALSCHPSYSLGRSRKTGSSRLVWAAEEAQDRLRQLRKILFQKWKVRQGLDLQPNSQVLSQRMQGPRLNTRKEKNNNSKYKQGRFLSSALSTQPLPDPTSIISLLWIFPDIVFCLCSPTEIKIVMFWVIFV